MIAALHKRTEIGREVIDEEALRACPVKEVYHYIERNFLPNMRMPSLWAR